MKRLLAGRFPCAPEHSGADGGERQGTTEGAHWPRDLVRANVVAVALPFETHSTGAYDVYEVRHTLSIAMNSPNRLSVDCAVDPE